MGNANRFNEAGAGNILLFIGNWLLDTARRSMGQIGSKDCNSLTSVGDHAFFDNLHLTGATIGNEVTSIGNYAFALDANLTSIGAYLFYDCASVAKVHFSGNAPVADPSVFSAYPYYDPVTVYYLPGTLGWSDTFAGRPTAQWSLPQPLILNQGPGFGVQSNQFGFTISWASTTPVVVEACTNLSNPVWLPVATMTLTNGLVHFTEPMNGSKRFYRIGTP